MVCGISSRLYSTCGSSGPGNWGLFFPPLDGHYRLCRWTKHRQVLAGIVDYCSILNPQSSILNQSQCHPPSLAGGRRHPFLHFRSILFYTCIASAYASASACAFVSTTAPASLLCFLNCTINCRSISLPICYLHHAIYEYVLHHMHRLPHRALHNALHRILHHVRDFGL